MVKETIVRILLQGKRSDLNPVAPSFTVVLSPTTGQLRECCKRAILLRTATSAARKRAITALSFLNTYKGRSDSERERRGQRFKVLNGEY